MAGAAQQGRVDGAGVKGRVKPGGKQGSLGVLYHSHRLLVDFTSRTQYPFFTVTYHILLKLKGMNTAKY